MPSMALMMITTLLVFSERDGRAPVMARIFLTCTILALNYRHLVVKLNSEF